MRPIFGRKKKTSDAETGDFFCEYASGGGMDGGSTNISLTRSGDGPPVLDYSICRYIGDEPNEGKKEVPEEAVRRITELYRICGINRLGKLKP